MAGERLADRSLAGFHFVDDFCGDAKLSCDFDKRQDAILQQLSDFSSRNAPAMCQMRERDRVVQVFEWITF